jgi:hypothetical protein
MELRGKFMQLSGQKSGSGIMNEPKLIRWLAVMVFALVPVTVLSQSKLDPGRLPKSTVFYLAWHGTPPVEARNANSLLALWDDADFAPVRGALIEEIMQEPASSQKMQPPLTQEELMEYASLLDNEFVFGYIGNPNASKSGNAASTSPVNTWNGAFFVYDRTGKEATLAKLLLRTRMREKDAPKISSTTIAGISAMKMERKTGTSYWTEDGKYAFTASEPAVFEQIAAWTRHAGPESAGLAQTAAYREAGDLLKGGVVEFFFHFPSIREMTSATSASGFQLRPLLQNLKIEAVHAVAGRLSLEGARTRMEGGILGETNPGTLFDIWDEGTATPQSWRFVSANTVSYHESRVNLLGIYAVITHALQSTAAAGQRSPMDFIETAAATRLGMPLPTALSLFSGEFATLQTSATLDPGKQVYVLGIRKKPEMLKLLRAGFADRVSGERTDGDTTFLKVSEGGIESSAGTASWKYYHLGVTNDLIVAASRNDSVREMLAGRNSGAVVPAPPMWQAARAKFPATINGLSFLDFQKIDWSAAKARWNTEPKKSSTTARVDQTARPGVLRNALKDLDPQVFSRHLRFAAGASSKDAQGVHFDGWIE